MTLNESEKYYVLHIVDSHGELTAGQLRNSVQKDYEAALADKGAIGHDILISFCKQFNNKIQPLEDKELDELIQDAIRTGSLLDESPHISDISK